MAKAKSKPETARSSEPKSARAPKGEKSASKSSAVPDDDIDEDVDRIADRIVAQEMAAAAAAKADDAELPSLKTDKLTPVGKLTKDLRAMVGSMSREEARLLVDSYYTMQDQRIRTGNQVSAMGKTGEPHAVLKWFNDQNEALEAQVKAALSRYAEYHPLGEWPLSVMGIGPVLVAGLIAHIDMNKAPTVGHIWRFAGQDPTSVWEKGKKRPWNAALKVICWKIGESFVKVSNREGAFYGHLYKKKKEELTTLNEQLKFAPAAAMALQKKNYSKDTDAYAAYSVGKLPKAHIHARAKRYAVKLFLAHLHDRWHWVVFGKAPPAPYPIAILGHAHYIAPPTAPQSAAKDEAA